MKHFSCMCGKRTAFGSDAPAPCDGCPDCGTTLDDNSWLNSTPAPHKWGESEWVIDPKTGERQQVQRCQNFHCDATRTVEESHTPAHRVDGVSE